MADPAQIDNSDERAALGRIVHAFREYSQAALLAVSRWQANFDRLPKHHQVLLHSQHAKAEAARRGIAVNQGFITAMLSAFDEEDGGPPHLMHANAAADEAKAAHPMVSHGEADKARDPLGGRADMRPPTGRLIQAMHNGTYRGRLCRLPLTWIVPLPCPPQVQYVLKNLARDWSADGANERERCYGPILRELRNLFGSDSGRPANAAPPLVLLPGAGLGRLCVEVAGLGLRAEGNEFSYHMLLASSFILNNCCEAGQFAVHPWVLSSCNQLSDEGQLRAVRLPDRPPSEIVAGPGLLSMCAGDFVVSGWAVVPVHPACFWEEPTYHPLPPLCFLQLAHCREERATWSSLPTCTLGAACHPPPPMLPAGGLLF